MARPGRLAALLCATVHGVSGASLTDLISAHYPAQYVARSLGPGESISIDGSLDDSGWQGVPWLDNFLDLAGPRYAGKGTSSWEEASREYAQRFTGSANPTRVKIRWDEAYLYIGVELTSRKVAATVTGHCDDLVSDVWSGTPVLPYFDDDFEVFLNPSQDNYYYVEFEVSARNATYSTLWSLPQAGLGSVAPECGGGDSPRKICCNTTWNGGKGLCDKPPVEHEGGVWTMEEYAPAARPGTGMLSATRNNTGSWSAELRFPILSTVSHGGLINLNDGGHYPGTDPTALDPNAGRRFWGGTFANALHAPWWATLNKTSTKEPEYIEKLCKDVISGDDARNGGYSQFLVDANNAAPTCYYEASSQHLGGHQYMHNPEQYGYIQFAKGTDAVAPCKNVLWPARFVLAMIYQAQVQYLTADAFGNGSYATKMEALLAPGVCSIENACNATALRDALALVSVEIDANATATTGPCARYAIDSRQAANWTGGPCFTATATYEVQRKGGSETARVMATIDEARLLRADPVGQRWNDPDAEWLCLDDVEVRK